MAIIAFLVWILLISVFTKLKNYFFKFLVGSVGLFCFVMYLGRKTLVASFSYVVAYMVWLIGHLFRFYSVSPAHFVITVYHNLEAVSFIIDYECSGFVEVVVYLSCLWFYPIYFLYEKAVYSVFGMVCIFGANVLRILFIAVVVHIFGNQLLFIAHTVLARLLFFVIMLVLYYMVFTKPHILRQKVGSFLYANDK